MTVIASQGAKLVGSESEARALAASLNRPDRARPVVVVSTAAGQAAPYVDVDEIAEALADLAEIYIVPTGDVSWAFSVAMPAQTQVYGGASRVYPTDTSWVTRPSASPLRFAFGIHDRVRMTELLIADAMGMALAAGLFKAPSAGRLVTAGGAVLGTAGGRALVDTDRGMASVWPELTVPGVAAERLFVKGMTVTGDLDSESHRLDVRASMRSTASLAQAYSAGQTVLGRVARVDKGGCHLELLPELRVFADRSVVVADQKVALTELLTMGEVVKATVVTVGATTGKGWVLDLIDVDPEAEPYAPALFAGGPPWLALAEAVAPPVEVEPPANAVVTEEPPAPVAPGGGNAQELASQLAAMRQERDGYLHELASARTRLERLEVERTRLRAQAREASNVADRRAREADGLAAQLAVSANDGHLFAHPVDQLEFEVRLAWARRTTPDEKSSLPLAAYELAEGFIASLDDVDGISRQKVVDVVVDVLTGRVHELGSRDSHQLRESDGPSAAYVKRADGSTCWRVALQRNTPQARRLHYWQRPDGSVELSAVRKHDDMRP